MKQCWDLKHSPANGALSQCCDRAEPVNALKTAANRALAVIQLAD
eukprot:CAMPEP_0203970520 /NCGR_PEP_ID=MMETSP0359-20131031/98009_1 /ASSEMBLY_ACC=CAM_ASM_000338 /TAXON_ID=268821 /ORGANISM="Scrippsiella Hangoei, Strain SHTV-5" /LENGTH=44 /DNA_ID= /DNA_START= /DNA_END= /DNA_ORIENTATION=